MAEILAAGYSLIRGYVVANWGRVVLYDGSGVAQLTLAAGDGRVAWSGSGNPRTLTVTLAGGEADVVGRTFARVKVFASSDLTSATPLVDETFTAAGPIQVADSLTVTLTVEIPDIA